MCSDEIAIRVEKLGKRYVMPDSRRANDDGGFKRHLRQYLPFMRHDEHDYFWALRDVNFEVKRGEILGILGLNGSGKSTLLKILSGVVRPTTGRVQMRGRVGSLLEVGTGFHPDLTGRENVFMAGALLGLKQHEIRAKFDEIVDFAEIEQFIDVPVKRYSSGMYVRLAYAVASLLDSDVMILDEVMAVGDQSFRDKSQRNIKRLTNEGRTVLYVSHNIQSVRKICNKGMVLDGGILKKIGDIDEISRFYSSSIVNSSRSNIADAKPRVDLRSAIGFDGERKFPSLEWVETVNGEGVPTRLFRVGETLRIRVGYHAPQPQNFTYMAIFIVDDFGDRQIILHNLHDATAPTLDSRGVIECQIDDVRLNAGEYTMMIDIGKDHDGYLRRFDSLDCVPDAIRIEVELGNYLPWTGQSRGAFVQQSRWRSLEGVWAVDGHEKEE